MRAVERRCSCKDEIWDKPVSNKFLKNQINPKYDDKNFWSHNRFVHRNYYRGYNDAFLKSKSLEAFDIEREFDSVLGTKSLTSFSQYDHNPVIQRPRDIILHSPPSFTNIDKNFALTGVRSLLLKLIKLDKKL